MNKDNAKTLRYWFWWPAKSFDTFEADRPPVMQVAKNIYAPLVSEFLEGKPQGMIAESWTVDKTGKIWEFKIRKDIYFEDGTLITAEIVLKNFRRIFWLTRGEGLVLNSLLPELKTWKNYHDPLPSLYVDGNTVIFKFDKRPIGLFEGMGQAIYGIAHPKCFDTETGKWLDPFCSCASGQYKVIAREEGKITLQSRHIYPALNYSPEIVEIYNPKEHIDKDNVVKAMLEGRGDLTVEHSFGINQKTLVDLQNKALKITYEPPVRMHFVHLNHNRGPFKDKQLRQSIRNEFLKTLKLDKRYALNKMEVNASFIPRGGVGYLDFDFTKVGHHKKANGEIVEVLFFPIAGDIEIQNSIEESVVDVLKSHNLTPHVTKYTERSEAFDRLRKGNFDVIVRGTGILVNNPYGDLRMMFMSKVGALIPDPSNIIPSIIENAEIEDDSNKRVDYIERINKHIFDDSAIITFAHSQLIYIHKDRIDLSKINLFSDPMEFRAVELH